MRIDASRAIGGHAAVTTLALVWVALASAAAPPAQFATIDAKRIDIHKPDGTLRLVITDAAHRRGIVLGKRTIRTRDAPTSG